MKLSTLIATALLATAAVACTVDRQSVAQSTPDLLSEYDQLQKDESSLKDQVAKDEQSLASAQATPAIEDDQQASAQLAKDQESLASLEERFAAFEQKVLSRQSQPFQALPYGLGALITAAVPLLGSRGRAQYALALRKASKLQLLGTVGQVLTALGANHSEQPSQPTVTTTGSVPGSTNITISASGNP
jgi:hypothetical protein